MSSDDINGAKKFGDERFTPFGYFRIENKRFVYRLLTSTLAGGDIFVVVPGTPGFGLAILLII